MDGRHHRAQVIIVPVPFEGGSPKEGRRQPPPAYKRNAHEPWRPATRPPSKAEALRKLLERVDRQNEEERAFMANARRAA
jgi:hypothetical protein